MTMFQTGMLDKENLSLIHRWFDIGVNLTNTQFLNDYQLQVEQAQQAGVECMSITGTCIDSSKQAAIVSQQFKGVYATAGVHPHDAKSVQPDYLRQLENIYNSYETVKAIGECGLDFNRDFSPRDQQEKVFAEQLALAVKLKAPVFLHQRDAHERFLAILSQYRSQLTQVVVHCFTGNATELAEYLALDCYVGITGWICDERRGLAVRELVKDIPLDRLLLETDAPFLLPRDLKPKPKSRRNLPCYLPHIAQQVALEKTISLTELSKQTFLNSLAFFNIKAGC